MTLSQDTKTNVRGALPSNNASREILNAVDGVHDMAASATITNVASTSNVSLVTFTLKDINGNALTRSQVADFYLSDSATGDGLTGTTASGAVAAGATGADLAVLSTKKNTRGKTSATGVYIMSITDTSKTTFYPCVALPNGKVIVGAQLTSGSYG